MPFENIFHELDHFFHFDIQKGRNQRIPLETVSMRKIPYITKQLSSGY